MRRLLIVSACVLGIGLSATTASALPVSVGDAYYLGFVDPGTPASPEREVLYVNYLITLAPGDIETDVDLPPHPQDYTFSRENSSYTDPLSSAILSGFIRSETTGGPSDVSGFYYLAAKYGTATHVWVLNGLAGSIELPPVIPGDGGLSHWTMFRSGPPISVPDGGATLGLLGFAMLGLGLLRQRFM